MANKNTNSDVIFDVNLSIEAVGVTEAAAIASYELMGKGDEKAADQVAVNAMRNALRKMNIEGTVVIGEGERDKAPMLFIGEKVGSGVGPKIDIALDPLEGTTICATGGANSMSVIAMTESGGLLNAPDVYMEKIAVGLPYKEQIVDLDEKISKNLKNLALAKKCEVEDLMVVVLDRPRHQELIANIREAGARIQLISDGDIAAVIATTRPESGVDMYVGTGGAPEGVLAAAALATTGGQMMGKLVFNDEEQIERAKTMGINDINKKYIVSDMANGKEIIFAATGVTDGSMLDGVKYKKNKSIITHSIAMSSHFKTIRQIRTEHRLKAV